MTLRVEPKRHGPFPGVVEPALVAAYADATADDTAAVLAGAAVPAVFPIVLAFEAGEQARADLPSAIWARVRGGVHGEHDVVLHRPLRPGEVIETWTELSAVRTVRPGTMVVVHFEHYGVDGALAVEQWWSMILLGLDGVADLGALPADHRFPESAHANPLGTAHQHVAHDTARKYAEVSADWSAHHFDIDVASSEGFDFLFAHGLCTMAMCVHRVLGIVGVDDPGRVARVAVRFASPTPLGGDVTVRAYGAGAGVVVFDAVCGDASVITHGRLELRP
ncbi:MULTISPECIES: MaoC/PaaZ C-terminal domain-containing protein [unclassified Mycobacterium]|uniref:MaoC/PaaZ C-terminal domain-containing protein n=1 Tax=unclassified Mycobacterium TaxID=2642494 RepID=UPI0029C86972|nr:MULTISPECIES: MaoC/PaaZ C-terminal domain-containing protein [unclassified Mycobacterium]